MTNLQIDKFKLISDVRKLRIALVGLTIVQVAYVILIFSPGNLYAILYFDYKINWIMRILHLLIAAIFILYNWKWLPIEKKKKKDNTWMILFLGVIGMWLWIPTKTELHVLIENNSANKTKTNV